MSARTRDSTNYVASRISPEDLHLFAVEAVEKVMRIARSAQHKTNRSQAEVVQFCGTLSSVLYSIKSQLQETLESGGEAPKKVESLLNNLERLCSWPRSLIKSDSSRHINRWRILNALQFSPQADKASECLKSFASANDIVTTRRRVELLKKLRSFYSKDAEKEFIYALTKRNSQAPPLHRRPQLQHTGFDLGKDIKCLYSILRQYRSCELDGSRRDIVTQIRLNGYKSLVFEGTTAEFGVLFFDHPHEGKCHWKEACIQICQSTPSNAPKVRFDDYDAEERTSSCREHEIRTVVSRHDFCKHISGRDQAQILFAAQNGEFVLQRNRNVSRNWIANQHSVPLATLLNDPRAMFTEKMKGILALLLAKATLQFYDSELIGQGLTKQNIRFLFEERDRIQGVYVNEPMLVIEFNEDDIKSQRQTMSSAMIHDMPKILALGLLLLELETKTSMETYREDQDLCPQGEMSINTDYRIAERLLDPNYPNYIIPEMGPLSPFRTVLPTCVRAGEMSRKLGESFTMQQKASPSLEQSEALRSVIYSEIVLPLEKWVSNYDKPDTVNVLLKSTQRRRSFAQRTVKTPHVELRQRTGAIPSYHDFDQEKRLRQLSREWFENYNQLTEILQPEGNETKNGHRPVRVCVLDTGIKKDDYEVYQDYGTIAQYKDFTETTESGGPCDKTGHGSAAVALLVKTCPNVSLYLARVIKTNKTTCGDVDNVVKAFDWATSCEVDIITMAIGFNDYQREVATAISRARAKQILVFSAVSNAQNMDSILFPAKDHGQVLGMFSTNGGNRESRDINPSPDDRPHSLAIFGEGVEIAEDLPLVTGTSYSTSIAAGLAATLLDFSRQETDREDISDISRLEEMGVMTMVFLEMARESSDGRYKCIRPWDLLKSQLRSRDEITTSTQRKNQREWIRGTIERLIEKV